VSLLVLGIDPGFASLGLAVVELLPVGERIVSVQVLRTQPNKAKRNIRKADDNSDRARELARLLEAAITPDVVALCVEAIALPFGRVQHSVVSNLGRIRGVLDALAEVHGLPIIEETPGTLKLLATGDRTASKEVVQECLEERFPGLEALWPPQKGLIEHASDAVAAVLAGLQSDVVLAARRARGAA
jgi:Holliday junction resolvasome RuvABC endonuclease subunit